MAKTEEVLEKRTLGLGKNPPSYVTKRRITVRGIFNYLWKEISLNSLYKVQRHSKLLCLGKTS